MRIYVRWGYARSLGEYIPKGEYEDDDPALYGMAAYLLENGHAVEAGTSYVTENFADQEPTFTVVEDDDPEDGSVDDLDIATEANADLEAVAKEFDLEAMTRAELRVLAADLGIAGAGSLTKTEALDVLKSHFEDDAQG